MTFKAPKDGVFQVNITFYDGRNSLKFEEFVSADMEAPESDPRMQEASDNLLRKAHLFYLIYGQNLSG